MRSLSASRNCSLFHKPLRYLSQETAGLETFDVVTVTQGLDGAALA